jgi:PAS domain S-box-containing protein
VSAGIGPGLLRGSVRRQLVAAVALVHAVMMTLFIWDLTVRQQGLLLDQQAGQAQSLAQSVATSAGVWLVSRDLTGLQEIIEAQKRYPELLYAMVLDQDGVVLAHTDRQRLGQYLADLPHQAQLTTLQRTPALVDVASPVMVAGRHVGWVRVGVGQEATGARLAKITRNGILYALVAIVVGAALAAAMGTYLTRRLYAIQAVADAVRAGDTARRAPQDGHDEAAQLARQFNDMLDTLVEREREINASHAALHRSETRFRRAMLGANDGLWDWDMQTDRVYYSPRWKAMLGYHEHELEGNLATWEHLVHPADLPRMRAAIQDYVDGRRPAYEVEYRLRHKNGQWVHVLARGHLERDEAGRPLCLTGTHVDITERKHAEQEIHRLNAALEGSVRERTAQLEVTVRELESFAYSVSHDLRTPLRGIDGFSAILLEDYGGQLDATARDHLQRVRAGTQRMGHLIDDLLKLSRVTRAPLQIEPLDLTAMVQEVVAAQRAAFPGRRVDVVVQPGLQVQGDRGLLQLALENLLSNAWKYTATRVAPHVDIGARQQGGETVYFVRDNGIGFDMQYAHKIFSPFQRLHQPHEFEGSGIGLATVARVIARHGGRVWAESEVGQGATFYFVLADSGAIAQPTRELHA